MLGENYIYNMIKSSTKLCCRREMCCKKKTSIFCRQDKTVKMFIFFYLSTKLYGFYNGNIGL